MNSLINGFKNLDNSIKRTIIGGIIIILVLFIFVFIVGTMNNKKISYSKLETKIQNAAERYYEKNEDKLPALNESTNISVKKLIEEGYIKELSEYNDDKCDANISVENNNGEYLYATSLKCDNYSTNTLATQIKKIESIVTAKDGLYQYDNEFVYRGENVNNYLMFSDILWRILRINEDGTIRIMMVGNYGTYEWDDRYNIEKDNYVGINDFEVSRVKDYLNEFGQDEDYITRNSKKYIVSKKVCLDKIDSLDFSNINAMNCNQYSDDKYQFAMINLNEYFVASIDSNCNNINSESCTNYNYLANERYWTITPSKSDSSKVYTTGSYTKASETDDGYSLKIVTNLSSNVLYSSGDGTKEKPYTIKVD